MQLGTFMGHCSLSEFDIACNSSSDVLVQEGFMRRRSLWRCALRCLQYNCWDLNHIMKIPGKWRHSSVVFNKGKGEPRNRPRRTHRVSGGIAQLFLNLCTRRGCVVSITPRPPLPQGKTRYPLYRRLGWPRSRSG
jgi:hypothetical protein